SHRRRSRARRDRASAAASPRAVLQDWHPSLRRTEPSQPPPGGYRSILVLFQLGVAGCPGLPQHVTPLFGGEMPCRDKQMIGTSVQIGEGGGIARLGLTERDGGPLGAANDAARLVNEGHGHRPSRQDEAGEGR